MIHVHTMFLIRLFQLNYTEIYLAPPPLKKAKSNIETGALISHDSKQTYVRSPNIIIINIYIALFFEKNSKRCINELSTFIQDTHIEVALNTGMWFRHLPWIWVSDIYNPFMVSVLFLGHQINVAHWQWIIVSNHCPCKAYYTPLLTVKRRLSGTTTSIRATVRPSGETEHKLVIGPLITVCQNLSQQHKNCKKDKPMLRSWV